MARVANPKLKRIMSRMTDLEHQEIPKDAITLFYGGKGVGKTTATQGLAQKLRGDGRILFCDSADGWVSLDNIPALKVATSLFPVEQPSDLVVIANAIATKEPGFEDITVVVIDEISSLYTDLLHGYVREAAGATEDEMLPVIDWNQHAAPQAMFLNAIKKFHKIPGLHLLMVAHETSKTIKNDASNERIVPSIGSKLSESIGQLAHVVARFESRQVGNEYRREAQVQPTRYVDAKSRIGGLPRTVPVTELVKRTAEWINNSRQFAEDTTGPEESVVYEDAADEVGEDQDDLPGEDADEDYEVSDDESDDPAGD